MRSHILIDRIYELVLTRMRCVGVSSCVERPFFCVALLRLLLFVLRTNEKKNGQFWIKVSWIRWLRAICLLHRVGPESWEVTCAEGRHSTDYTIGFTGWWWPQFRPIGNQLVCENPKFLTPHAKHSQSVSRWMAGANRKSRSRKKNISDHRIWNATVFKSYNKSF